MKRLFRRHSKLVTYKTFLSSTFDDYNDPVDVPVSKTIKAMKDMTTRPLTFIDEKGDERVARVTFWVERGAVTVVEDNRKSEIHDTRQYLVVKVDDTHGEYDRLWCEEMRNSTNAGS